MDQRMSQRTSQPMNREHQRASQAIEEKLSFGDQLREFLRVNTNLLLASGVALLLISDVFGTHGVLAMRRSQKQAADIEKKIEQLNQENRQLEDRVKALKTDPAAVEHIAREEMGLARPGEYIFKVAPKQPGGSPDSQTPETSTAKP
jgi:cell division protein FtsB